MTPRTACLAQLALVWLLAAILFIGIALAIQPEPQVIAMVP